MIATMRRSFGVQVLVHSAPSRTRTMVLALVIALTATALGAVGLVSAHAATGDQNFDGVTAPALPVGWTTTGSPAWVTSTTTPDTAPNDAYSGNVNNADSSLVSPALPVRASGASMSFRKNYNLETGYDFLYLEASVNGGAFTDIVTAGGIFTAGLPNSGNGWSGNSGGYITSTVTLPPSANSGSIQLRWRVLTDASITSGGVRVDTITFTGLGTAPAFTSANSTSASEETAMAPFMVTTTGVPDAAISVTSGSLPSGVGLVSNGDGTATISGAPADGTAGPHLVTLAAANGVSPDATQTFILTVNSVIPVATPQIPEMNCVTVGTSVPRRGNMKLMNASCHTNTRNTIGLRASAKLRGDAQYFRLYCKVSSTKTRAVSKNSSGAYCKTGAMYIRTYGYKLLLRVTWSAPATGDYAAYKKVKTYKT